MSLCPHTPLTHLCSCRHCGPAHSPHHRHSGTFQAGSHSSRTHRGFPERTHPRLWRSQVRPPPPPGTHWLCPSLWPPQALPWQVWRSSVGLKPISHSQRYPPGALRHCPFSQRSTSSAHSSLSECTREAEGWGPASQDPRRAGRWPWSLEPFTVT